MHMPELTFIENKIKMEFLTQDSINFLDPVMFNLAEEKK
jgi:hypothetical protein